jgi:hypothetical protein
MLNPYEEWEMEPEERLDLGHDVVFGVLRQRGRPIGSSGEVRIRYASVAVWIEGLIERQME